MVEPQDEELKSKRAVAQHYGVAPKTVFEWDKRSGFPCLPCKVSVFDEFLKTHRLGPYRRQIPGSSFVGQIAGYPLSGSAVERRAFWKEKQDEAVYRRMCGELVSREAFTKRMRAVVSDIKGLLQNFPDQMALLISDDSAKSVVRSEALALVDSLLLMMANAFEADRSADDEHD